MTLIELLVVLVILSLVVGAAIPLLAPSTSERQLREAARGLNAFIGSAQARAVAHARPYGIAIKRLSQDTGNNAAGDPLNNNGVGVEVFIVEQPAPYAGMDDWAAARLAIDNGPTGGAGQVLVRFVRRGTAAPIGLDKLPIGWDPEPLPPGMIRPGDVVEVNGSRFILTDTGTNNSYLDANGFYKQNAGTPPGTFVTRPINGTGQEIQIHHDNQGYKLTDPRPVIGFQPPYWTLPCSYKILRQPMPTSDEPYQLPEGTVIDLRASGIGGVDPEDVTGIQLFHRPRDPLEAPNDPKIVDNDRHVMIMFSPEGRIERVQYYLGPTSAPIVSSQPVVENIFLLVGPNVPPPPRADTEDKTLSAAGWSPIPPLTDEQKQQLRAPINWLRGDSRWLVIGAATGRVVTIENALVDPEALNDMIMTMGTMSAEDQRSRQVLAARQLTREMVQLGGR